MCIWTCGFTICFKQRNSKRKMTLAAPPTFSSKTIALLFLLATRRMYSIKEGTHCSEIGPAWQDLNSLLGELSGDKSSVSWLLWQDWHLLVGIPTSYILVNFLCGHVLWKRKQDHKSVVANGKPYNRDAGAWNTRVVPMLCYWLGRCIEANGETNGDLQYSI